VNISLNHSAMNTISTAHVEAASASQAIATDNSFDTGNILNLKEANVQNSSGVKPLQAEETMLGSLLDVKA
jgi:hypothetical protein